MGLKSKEKSIGGKKKGVGLLRAIAYNEAVQIFLQDVPRLWKDRSPHGGLTFHCVCFHALYFGICYWPL